MPTPVLEHITQTHDPADSEVEVFRVVQEGEFAGRQWREGAILLCHGEPRTGDAVVLVARGRQGRPRMGRVEGTRFFGEAGEPCHPARWRVAGRLVGAGELRGEGWVVALEAALDRRGEALSHPAAPPREAEFQLSLFAA